jgi:hypothetical protein
MENLQTPLAPKRIQPIGWHRIVDATDAKREALLNRARRHEHEGLLIVGGGRITLSCCDLSAGCFLPTL